MLIERMIDEGVRIFDLGLGHYAYKQRLGGHETPVRTIVLAANDPISRMRTERYCRLAELGDKAYYKAYRCRLAPRLSLAQRSLSRAWIRSRL